MPQYITQNGLQFVQLDNGALVPVNVTLSLEGGTLFKLTTEQLNLLRSPVLPSSYPLPSEQVADLKIVAVSNFPGSWAISNFPASYNVANLPSTFPLPSGQESLINGINTWLQSLSRGIGAADASTLRVASSAPVPSNHPRTSIAATGAAQILAAANAGRRTLKIYNDSPAILYLGIGTTNPTLTDFTAKIFPDDFYEALASEAGAEHRGIFDAAVGAARVTEGI